MNQWGRRAAATFLVSVSVALVAAAPAAAESQTVFNTSPITFSGATEGPGSPNPSNIQVSGLEGPITDVNLHINAIDAKDLQHLSLMLVSPSGETEIPKVYSCDDQDTTGPVDNFFMTFDQQAASALPVSGDGPCVDGASYRPGRCACHDTPWWTSIAGYPHSSNFDNFNNENANGTWRLYAHRSFCDSTTCAGTDQIEAGWSLSITTGAINLDVPGGIATFGPASPYPSSRLMTQERGLITDVDVQILGIFHNNPDDLEIMLEKDAGPKVMLMSDACGSFDAAAYGWLWDDEAPAAMADNGSTAVCATTRQRPTDHNPGDSLPAPAPPGPYATSLSAFDLLDPRGEWRLWVADDTAGEEGFFTHSFVLAIATRPRAATAFDVTDVEVDEGATAALTVTRSGASDYAAGSVDVDSGSGTAADGDFEPVDRTLAFGPGETTKTVEIQIPEDATAEGAETFTLTLSEPLGDTDTAAPLTTTVTIPANDGGTDGPPDITPPRDTTPPETTIDRAPKRKAAKRRARVTFSASEAGSTFECSLDGAPFASCSSPLRLKRLRPGRHRIQIRAADAAGNVDTTPAKSRWRVVQRKSRGG